MTPHLRRFLPIGFALALCSAPAPVLGWGDVGHRAILEMAIDLMPPGDRAPMLSERNFELLDYYLLLPDRMSSRTDDLYRAGEGPNHYLNMEKLTPGGPKDYESFRMAVSGEDEKTGRIVSRIHECSARLAEAARRGNRGDWLHWAGFLAHYTGDAHQPLHTTSNHDGHETGNLMKLKDPAGDSVHIRYESGMLNAYGDELQARARDLVASYLAVNGGLEGEIARFRSNPDAYITSFIWGAHGHVSEVIDADNEITGQKPKYSMRKGRYYQKLYERLGELTAAQLARAAIAVAAIWGAASTPAALEEAKVQPSSEKLSTVVHKHDAPMSW